MRTIQRLVISRPVSTAMFYAGLVLIGILAFLRIETNLLPQLEFPRITIVTAYENAAPEEIEFLVTKPLSEAIGTVSGIQKVTSESVEGASFITAQFGWGTNVDFAVMELRERVDQIRNALPQDAERPIISRFDPSEDPFFEIVFFARALSNPEDLRHFVDNEVRVHLERVDGVALVELAGGYQKEIQIDVDPQLMVSHGLSLPFISERIRSSNMNLPAGHITVGSRDVLIRTLGEYGSLSEIGQTVVATSEGGAPVMLSRLATIRDGYRERRGLARYNGEECVIASLRKEAGKNTVRVAVDVRSQIQHLRERFGREIELHVVYDESRFIDQAMSNISTSLLIGAGLAFLSLVLILRNISSPLILVSVIPISLLSTIVLMYARGLSLNIMSLGGLALGVGMLFDSGNVILAAIERQSMAGLPPREAALKGASEVAGSVTIAVLTTVIVFLPVVFVESVAGIVFKEMALTITFSLLSSLLVSLTLIPMLASLRTRTGGRERLQKLTVIQLAAKGEEFLQKHYEERLFRLLDRPGPFFLLLGALLVAAFALLPFVRKEFLPAVDTGELTVEMLAPRSSALEFTSRSVQYIEQYASRAESAEHVLTRVGYDGDQVLSRRGADSETHRAEVRIVLGSERSVSAEQLAEHLRDNVRLRPDMRVSYRLSGDVLSDILTPDSRPITLEISGDELPILDRMGKEISGLIEGIPGVVDVRTTMDEQPPEYHLYYEEDRMAAAQIQNSDLARDLQIAVEGSVVSHYRVGDDEIDIRLRAAGSRPPTLASLETLRFRGEDDNYMSLEQLTQLVQEPGYTSILRSHNTRINRVTAGVEDVSLSDVFDEIDLRLEDLSIEPGYRVQFGGERENIEESFRELGLAFILAVVLIYMLLAAKFESLLHALLMMFTIPLIAIGILPALLLTGKSINVSAITGMILLVGIVVDNAGLFHEYLELLEREGFDLASAVVESGKIVLRPILLNNCTTLLALVPVAMELGEGTEFQSPMAIAVISGLATSVFLSLFVIPTLFYLVRRREKKA